MAVLAGDRDVAGFLRPLQEYTTTRLAAVERRRAVRRARTAIRRGDGCSLADLEEYESATVDRCVRRFVAEELRRHPIYHLFSYWQLRRVGYDAWSKLLRSTGKRNPKGELILLDPDATPTWFWWNDLHYKTRYMVAGRNPVTRRMEASWEIPALCNPAFAYGVLRVTADH